MFIETGSGSADETDRTAQNLTSNEASIAFDPETQRYYNQLEYMLLTSQPRITDADNNSDLDPSGAITE